MDKKTLEQQLEQLHKDSFAWALRCCFENRDTAEEILQNTYLKILEGKAKYHQKASFKTWLFSVIRFTAIDHYRAKKRKRTFALEMDHLQIANSEIHHQEITSSQSLFLKVLHQLSPQQSQLLHLVFYQNCSIQEAADIMGIQVGTARTHYKRGKEQLKKRLVKKGVINLED